MVTRFPATFVLAIPRKFANTKFFGQSYEQRSKEAKAKEAKASLYQSLLSFSSCSHIDLLSRNKIFVAAVQRELE
jgi:hypothetical protein